MANSKLTALPVVTTPKSASLLYIVQDGVSSGVTVANATKLSGIAYNVKDYGAIGDNSTDDTTAIQSAISASNSANGGYVFFPSGTYKITSALTLYTSISLVGEGMERVTIHQVTLNANGLTGDGLSSVLLQDLTVQGNGSGSTAGTGTGHGINLTYGSNGNNPYHNFRNVRFTNFGADGLHIQTAIVANFEKVYSSYNGNNGFNWYEGGTSCNFQDCFARQNAQSGFRLNGSAYICFSGCAADNNGISYEVLNAQGIGFFSCGTEGALNNGGSYPGIGWKISNGSNIGLHSCWCFDNRNLGVWVTASAQVVQIDCADNTPSGTAVNFIKVDTGCNASINGLHNTTANSLASGTTITVNDGAGGIVGLDLYALNQTALTVPFFNSNKALVSSAVTSTELGYLSGVTSAIQTQLNAKQATLTLPLTVANGGTGVGTLTGIVKASGTSNFTAVTAPSGAIVGDTDTQTLSAKTLTAPKIANAGFIADANGNEEIIFTTTASSVNEVTLNNAATGGVPGFQASGGDTDISVQFRGKGNGFTKVSVERQDDTTNSFKHNTITLTGWGVITIGAASNASETVTFGITFAQRPIVLLTFGGDATTATTYGSGANTVKGPVAAKAHTITATNFIAHIHSSDGTSWSAGNTVFYQWMAVGEI